MKIFHGNLSKSARFFYPLFTFLVIVFAVNGCIFVNSVSNDHVDLERAKVEVGPKISVFLSLKSPAGPDLVLRVSSVDVLAGDIWLPLNDKPFEINTGKIETGQIFAGRAVVPAGEYSRLRFVFEDGALDMNGGNKPISQAAGSVEIGLPAGFSVRDHDSKTLLTELDTEASLAGGHELRPSISITPFRDPFVAELVYVACPLINTIYIIRTDKNQVAGSLGISGRPTYIGADRANNRLYVLAADESVLKVVEISSNRIIDRIQIPLLTEPGFMALSSDRLWAYIIDEAGHYIFRINLTTGSLDNRARLGEAPSYVLDLPDQKLLAVSSGLSNEVLLLDPETLAVRDIIPVGSSPAGLLVSDSLLYIAESGSSTVTIYDLLARKVRRRLNVGFSPARLREAANRVYVSHAGQGKLSVINSGQFNIYKDILAPGRFGEMISTENRRWLYAGNSAAKGVTVIDTTGNRIAETIELNAAPLGFALVQ